MMTSRRSKKVFSSGLACALLSGSAQAQSDNFTDPPGVQLAAPGELGAVETIGVGPIDVILVADTDFNADVWDSFTVRNSNRYTMHTVTPAGAGRTTAPPMPAVDTEGFDQTVWLDNFDAALVAYIDEQELDRPLVVGHHWVGTQLALRFGLEHPELVGGVVVVSGTPRAVWPGEDATPANDAQRMRLINERWRPMMKSISQSSWVSGGWAPDLFSVNGASAQQIAGIYRQRSGRVSIRYITETWMTNLAPRLEGLEVPLLVVVANANYQEHVKRLAEANLSQFGGDRRAALRATQDQLVQSAGNAGAAKRRVMVEREKPLKEWQRVMSKIPDAKLVRVRDSEAFVWYDQPELFDREVNAFAERAAPAE